MEITVTVTKTPAPETPEPEPEPDAPALDPSGGIRITEALPDGRTRRVVVIPPPTPGISTGDPYDDDH